MAGISARKRGKTWSYSFEAAKIDGRRKRIEKGGFRTKKEALEAGAKAKAEYDNAGKVFHPSEVSLADYLNYWLENHVKKNLSHRTYLDYESKARIHIKPSIGHYRLCSIEADVIQNWIDDIKLKGYSISMVKNILACLSGALNYAVMPLRYIKSNPCNYVKLSRLKEDPRLKEKREYICSKEDWNRIIERFPEGSNFYLPLMIGYHLGTRVGETYGFDLSNDIDGNVIRVRRQLQKENRTWYQREPKYESYRSIDMDSIIKNVMRKEIIKRKERMMYYGEYYMKTYVNNGAIVQFPANMDIALPEIMPASVKENGELLTPESFKYCARVIHKELGIPDFHYHSLRHTHATILAENGASPKTVMERLGHKDIAVTLNKYTFNTEKMRSQAVEIFENAIL